MVNTEESTPPDRAFIAIPSPTQILSLLSVHSINFLGPVHKGNFFHLILFNFIC
jgi:hypothetical protein